MPTAPTPDPVIPAGILSTKLSVEAKTALSIGLGLLCLGIVVGFKIRGGVPDVLEIPSPAARAPRVLEPAPCVDCAEKRVQEARARMEAETVFGEGPTADQGGTTIPGFS
jgi:hypothetical protein